MIRTRTDSMMTLPRREGCGVAKIRGWHRTHQDGLVHNRETLVQKDKELSILVKRTMLKGLLKSFLNECFFIQLPDASLTWYSVSQGYRHGYADAITRSCW